MDLVARSGKNTAKVFKGVDGLKGAYPTRSLAGEVAAKMCDMLAKGESKLEKLERAQKKTKSL